MKHFDGLKNNTQDKFGFQRSTMCSRGQSHQNEMSGHTKEIAGCIKLTHTHTIQANVTNELLMLQISTKSFVSSKGTLLRKQIECDI